MKMKYIFWWIFLIKTFQKTQKNFFFTIFKKKFSKFSKKIFFQKFSKIFLNFQKKFSKIFKKIFFKNFQIIFFVQKCSRNFFSKIFNFFLNFQMDPPDFRPHPNGGWVKDPQLFQTPRFFRHALKWVFYNNLT